MVSKGDTIREKIRLFHANDHGSILDSICGWSLNILEPGLMPMTETPLRTLKSGSHKHNNLAYKIHIISFY